MANKVDKLYKGVEGMKRFLVVRNYSEYEQAIKYSSKVETITVISGERERKTLIDVIRASDSTNKGTVHLFV